METDEVTVVVHGARNLQGKKPGRCKFSVIFGVGSKRFRTSVVKEPSGNPDWNEESIVSVVNQNDNVFFTVTEKDDVLGQVQVPLSSLTLAKGQLKQVPLKVHRKCPSPHGDIIFQIFISKQRPVSEGVNPQIRSGGIHSGGGGREGERGGSVQLTGFARLRQSLAISPGLPRRGQQGPKRDKDAGSLGSDKDDKKRGSTLSYFNKKLSKSLHDIFHIGRSGNNEDDDNNKSKYGSVKGLDHSGLGGGEGDVPVVTNIIPNMVTVHGGTRLCVEGRNLGLGKSDIMEFMLCGTDLLDTIHFESDQRIYVTTKPNTPGKGDLWIETVSGGQNVLKNVFTFVDRAAEKNGTAEKQAPPDSPSAGLGPSPNRDPPPKPSPLMGKYRGDGEGESAGGAKVQRSSSQTDRGSSGIKSLSSLLSGATTLPRVKSTPGVEPLGDSGEATTMGQEETTPEMTKRFRKNHQMHARRASESFIAVQHGVERSSSASEKAELQKEIVHLMKENEALQKKNNDLNAYIQDLVAKVMENCPEVLAAMPTKK